MAKLTPEQLLEVKVIEDYAKLCEIDSSEAASLMAITYMLQQMPIIAFIVNDLVGVQHKTAVDTAKYLYQNLSDRMITAVEIETMRLSLSDNSLSEELRNHGEELLDEITDDIGIEVKNQSIFGFKD